jgi:hypothetical protein
MSFYFGQLDATGAVGPAGEVGQGWPPDLQHAVHSEMDLDRVDRRMPMLLDKWKCDDGRSKASAVQSSLERMTCPALVVSFGAGE